MTIKNTVPFVYKWIELSTNMWYIGSHYKKGCHPDDGYLCSSKVVKRLILDNPHNWHRTVLDICETPEQARFREAEILQSINARMQPMSYNQTNADGKFSFSGPHTEQTRLKIKVNHPDVSGENNPMYGREGGMKGKKHKEISKLQIGHSLKGRETSEEHAKKISEALTGLSWINNGSESKRVNLETTPLQEGWILGMLPDHAEKLAESRKGENHWNYGNTVSEETKAKIAHTLTGRKEPESTRQKKKEASKRRQQILCEGCRKMYYSCHKRHHIKCDAPTVNESE